MSHALSRPELLRPDTRRRVMHVVEQLGYDPTLMARGLRQRQAHALFFRAGKLGRNKCAARAATCGDSRILFDSCPLD
jgi:hypothetical protein